MNLDPIAAGLPVVNVENASVVDAEKVTLKVWKCPLMTMKRNIGAVRNVKTVG
jgi:hypothetical protein